MTEAPLLIAALVIVTIWGIYLFPSLFGNRKNAPLSSTEEFDRWTHVMADVQRRGYSARRASARDVVRARRRRALGLLIAVAAATLGAAYWFGSVTWLLAHLIIDAGLAWFVGMLLQVKQRQAARVADRHLVDRPGTADETQVRVVAGR